MQTQNPPNSEFHPRDPSNYKHQNILLFYIFSGKYWQHVSLAPFITVCGDRCGRDAVLWALKGLNDTVTAYLTLPVQHAGLHELTHSTSKFHLAPRPRRFDLGDEAAALQPE